MLSTILYNLLLFLVEALLAIRWNTAARNRQALSFLHPVVGGVSAIVLGENGFGVLRLFSWYVFLHLPILLGIATVLLYRRSPRLANFRICPSAQ